MYASQSGARCKECAKEYGRTRYRRIRSDPAAWEQKKLRDRGSRIQRKYGITLADQEAARERQGARCGICKDPLSDDFHIDHDHSTGTFRGLLCRYCNTSLPLVENHCEAALNYLRQEPGRETFVLSYPEAPKSLNAGGAGSRRHWSVAHQEKRRWEGLYVMLLLAEGVPTGMGHCSLEATIRWKTRARRDSTNYIAPIVKPLADALVKGGWLPDDTDEFFRFSGLTFEYPDVWRYSDPRVKSELVVCLRASYPERRVTGPGVPDA